MTTNTFILTIISICLPFAKSIHSDFPAVFNFGDSNSDTGELIATGIESLYPPNGHTYFKVPSGRCSDGRLIIDFLRFEQPLMACCGYGGSPLNYDSRVFCGETKILNGTTITAKGCTDSTDYINWDGIHYTETANQYVASQILPGKYSDPPFSDKMPFLLRLKF